MLKQQRSSIWGKPSREELLSQQSQIKQQLVSENRGRLFGGGGFEGNGGYIRPLGPAQSAWPPPLQVRLQNHQNPPPPPPGGSSTRAVFLGGSGVKRECAGTGVFLPRRYGNPSESRKKPGRFNGVFWLYLVLYLFGLVAFQPCLEAENSRENEEFAS